VQRCCKSNLPGEFLPSNGNVPGHLLLQGSREFGPIAYSFNTATRENGFVVFRIEDCCNVAANNGNGGEIFLESVAVLVKNVDLSKRELSHDTRKRNPVACAKVCSRGHAISDIYLKLASRKLACCANVSAARLKALC
jgi:hypothetical protein